VTVEFQKLAGDLVSTNKEGTITKKLDLQKQTQAHYVIGNQDYSILYSSGRVGCFPFSVL